MRKWKLLLGGMLVAAGVTAWGTAQNPTPGSEVTLPETAKGETPQFSPQELFKSLATSVFVVESLNAKGAVIGFGSGVAVAPSQMVTNNHVIKSGVSVRVRQGQKAWRATIAQIDPDHDLSLLRIEGLKAIPVRLRPSSTLAVGERVYAIGAPAGLELTLSEGLISGLREYGSSRLVQTSAAISPGSSGGGLFDEQGRLVGITTSFLLVGQNLNFAIPSEWIFNPPTRKLQMERTEAGRPPAGAALLWLMVGSKALENKDYAKAVSAFRMAVKIRPDDRLSRIVLGMALFVQHDFDGALVEYREAVRLDPSSAEGHEVLGSMLRYKGDVEGAILEYREAVRLKPEFAQAHLGLADALLEKNEIDNAFGELHDALRLKPSDPGVHSTLGIALYRKGDKEGAAAELSEALRLNRTQRRAHLYLGYVLADTWIMHGRTRLRVGGSD
jgi:Flp pilus assembly protein TadD